MRVRPRPWVLGTIGLLALLCLSFSSSQASERQYRPLAQDASAGAAIYARNCAICHGPAGNGRYGVPLANIPPEIRALPPEEITPLLIGLLRGGIPGYMPGFLPEQISDADAVELTRYLLSLDPAPLTPSFYDAMERITADQAAGRTFFPETGHSVGGEFRDFWNRYGGLRVFGYPITEEFLDASYTDGRIYRMQLFERARFELHPDAPAGQRVQLALLGSEHMQLRTYAFSGMGPPLPEGPPPGAEGGPPGGNGGGNGGGGGTP
ncbi:MAG TPA: c-type cytochrome [Chloroflexaceae bacterium]|nr:c-type cytochrome [Chloroflexaceae bacterium]